MPRGDRWLLVCCFAAVLPMAAAAQVIPIRTVSVAEGDQFTFLPSASRGMAHVSIAVDDTLLDSFVNPAKAARLARGYYFGAPSLYTLSRNGGNGTTLPIGIVTTVRSTLLGAALAVQDLSPPSSDAIFAPQPLSASSLFPGAAEVQHHTNRYAWGMLGRSFARARLSVATSVLWSGLHGVDGVDQLYPGSQRVDQFVDAVNIRVGALKTLANRQVVEALLVHNRYAARHDVSYREFLWDPVSRSVLENPHIDHNYDQTHLWGLHLRYERLRADSLWRIGTVLTANRTTQPTVPPFGVMNVGGDPGRSTALNAGVGLARMFGTTTVGMDAIYEPVWTRSESGGTTDRYRFSNVIARAGVRHDLIAFVDGAVLQMQGGAQLHAMRYVVDDAVAPTRSRARWNEWTHALGMSYKTSSLVLQYQWRLLSGVQRLGFPDFGGIAQPLPIDILPAPAPTTMRMLPVRVTTQQLSIAVPIR